MPKKNNNETFECPDCGLHYHEKRLADACKVACDKGACDSKITTQSIERSGSGEGASIPESKKTATGSESEDTSKKAENARANTETTQDFEAMWKRALADYQNLLKEMSAERLRMRKSVLRDIVETFLPIMDNFSASTAHEPKTDDAKVKSWVQGVGHIRKQMEDMLAEFGVRRIESEGKAFDAKTMEAVGEEAGNGESGEVLREISAGYVMDDVVIRPARVIIIK